MASKKVEVSKRLFTVAEASEITGLASTQILYRIKTGKLKAQKLGWFWVIPKEEIDRFIEGDDDE